MARGDPRLSQRAWLACVHLVQQDTAQYFTHCQCVYATSCVRDSCACSSLCVRLTPCIAMAARLHAGVKV